MSETVKINLSKVIACMTIVLMAASVVGAGYIAYDNAKSAKTAAESNADKIAKLETRQARFEGKMDERTANTLKRVDDIYDIVKEWEKE